MSTSFASQNAWVPVNQHPLSTPTMSQDGYAKPAGDVYGAPRQSMGWTGLEGGYEHSMMQNDMASNGAASSGGYFQPRQAQDARAYTHPAGNYYRPTADANTTGRRQPHPDAGAYHMQTAPFPATNSSHYPAALPAQGLSVAYNMTTSPDPMNMNQFETESFVGQGVHGPNAPAKRQRANAASFDDADDADDEDREMNRLRPQGACARCKGLKVKCEFRADTDVCKRCLNAGQPCQIPGRKKRRTPPKREHLLNQIREQADVIKNLMGQLEQLGHAPRSANGSNSARTSPMVSPSSLPCELESTSSRERVAPAVEEWMAKARERIDDFISVAGSAPISYVQDDADGSDDEYEDSEYEFAIVDYNGEVTTPEVAASRRDSAPNGVPTKKRTYSGKLATLPSEAAPYGLMANLSLKAHPRRVGSQGEVMQSPEEDSELSIANDDFFRKRSVLEASPGPDAERPRETAVFEYPAILARGIITPDIAESLFSICFGTMNQSVSLLDPVLYTAPRTCVRSPFLFTVICALASRFHPDHLKVYPQLMRFAHLAAGTALISGTKTVDMCHAFILLSLYPMPTKRWEDDRSWIFLGTAIRIAMDLNLQYPNTAKPQNENHAREMLNRTRLWINCYNLDRSMGSQYGKAPVINQADYTATHTHDWWRSSPYNLQNFDIHLCAYNADLRALSGFIRKVYSNPDHPMGLNKDVDLEQLSMESDDEIQALQKEWMGIIEQTDMTDSQNRFRAGLLRLAWSYARLAVLSYGFQHAFGRTNADENPFLMRCFTAAKDVVTSALDGLSQPDQKLYLRHGPEAQKVFVTFAASFLVKLLQPKFSHYFDYDRRVEIHGLVTRVIDFLSSPDIAVDDQHGPKLHARFLKGLLASPLAQVTQVRRTSSQSKSSHNSPPAAASSPESTTGMPTPATAATSFNDFTPINPFAQSAHTMGTATGDGANFNLEDMFSPPLQYDAAIFARMQELPAQWSDIAGMSTLPEQMMPERADVRGGGEVDWFTQLQNLSAQTPQSADWQYWPSQ